MSPQQEADALGLGEEAWARRIVEARSRLSLGPDGRVFEIEDTVVLLQRR